MLAGNNQRRENATVNGLDYYPLLSLPECERDVYVIKATLHFLLTHLAIAPSIFYFYSTT